MSAMSRLRPSVFVSLAKEDTWVARQIEVGIFRGQRKRIVGVLHGLTVAEVAADPDALVTFKKLDMLSINELDVYFEQLRDRVESTEFAS